MRSVPILIAAAVGVMLIGTPWQAAGVDNDDELACQLTTSKAIGKFIQKKTRCIDSCYKRAFKGADPADCQPPFAAATFGCVTSTEAKITGKMQSGCSQDCPECYSGGDCTTDADARILDAEGLVEDLAADVYCDDSLSPNHLELREFKCQRAVAKYLTKFAANKLKCYAKCRKGELAGKVAPGACDPPATDERTQLCIERAEEKTVPKIDRICPSVISPKNNKPECAPYDVNDGAAWVARVESEIDARHGDIFCNDP